MPPYPTHPPILTTGLHAVVASLLALSHVQADVTLPRVISHGMVLQRDRPLPIWGWAGPDEEVTVTLGEATARTRADAEGKWKLELPAMKADGKAHRMIVSGRIRIEVEDKPNGLLVMGHHSWINLKSDGPDGDGWPPGGSGHEVKGDYPYYPIFWEADPEAARRMLAAHWSSHIQDWGFMNFTRHGSFSRELNEAELWNRPRTEPVVGIVQGNLTFFDSGSDIVWAGAQLGRLSNDDRPLYWAQRLYARYSDSAHQKSQGR